VRGLQRLPENDVIAATGLKIGQFAGESEFKQAAQKLGETGLFSQLTYSYNYSTAGCDLGFQVTEDEKLVPIVFENFVWFSDEQLLDQLHKRVPLFTGKVPTGGDLTEQIAHALAAIISEQHISGEVEYLPFAPEDGPVQAYDYKINLHPVVVNSIDFPGAAPSELPLLQAAAKPLSGEEYLRTNLRAQEQHDFLPVYRARGYLKAQFADSQAKIVGDGAQTQVDVSLPVTPGIQYKLAGLQFAGNTAFPTEKLRELIHLKAGEPANVMQLGDDIDQIHKLYGTRGYLFAEIKPVPEMDDAHATVSYQLKVIENDVYRMADLNIDGLPDENANRMLAQWQLKKGDPYDNSYLQKFFNILYRDFGLRRSYDVAPKLSINREDKTVSVNLHFSPRN